MTLDDLDASIARYLDGASSKAEVLRLSERLESDPEARRIYLQAAEIHAALSADEGMPSVASPSIASARSRSWFRARRVGAIVAAGSLVAWAVLNDHGSSIVSRPAARITATHGAVRWTGDGGRALNLVAPGHEFRGGTLETQSIESWTVLQYEDGSSLTLSGTARLTVVDGRGKLVRLDHGRLSATVLPQPEGLPLTILTPAARLEGEGTRLSVDCDADSTRVRVNEGRVRVTRLVDERSVAVEAGHGIVAAISPNLKLVPARLPEPTRSWRSRLPDDLKFGRWEPRPEGKAMLFAQPVLDCAAKPKPLLLYLASFFSEGKGMSPIRLDDDARFVVSGRLDSAAELFFGVTLDHPLGGFAGKSIARRRFPGGAFEWVIDPRDLVPLEPVFPRSASGLELVGCWCLTVNEDHGLAVEEIELRVDR